MGKSELILNTSSDDKQFKISQLHVNQYAILVSMAVLRLAAAIAFTKRLKSKKLVRVCSDFMSTFITIVMLDKKEK